MSQDSQVEQRFRTVIEQGDAAGLRRLAAEHPQVTSMLDRPWFAFQAPAVVFAASRADRDLLRALVDLGADLDARSEWGAGPFGVLHHTCLTEPALAEELVEWGASLDAHSVAGLGRIDELRKMLEQDPNLVSRRGPDGQMPLSLSSTTEVADLLLEWGAELDAVCIDHQSTATQWLIGQRPEVSRHLIEKGATPDLFVAVALGDRELVERVLEDDPQSIDARLGQVGYDPVKPGNILDWNLGWGLAGGASSPHAVAAHLGHDDIFELLFESSPKKTRLLVACWMGDEKRARAIHDRHPELLQELTPSEACLLADAAWIGREEAVRVMLELGFDPHVPGAHDSTPLDRAAFHGFASIIALLLEHDPDPPLVKENEFGGHPLATLVYGSVNGWRDDGDYAAAAELLLGAGAQASSTMFKGASEAVAAVLRQHLTDQESAKPS